MLGLHAPLRVCGRQRHRVCVHGDCGPSLFKLRGRHLLIFCRRLKLHGLRGWRLLVCRRHELHALFGPILMRGRQRHLLRLHSGRGSGLHSVRGRLLLVCSWLLQLHSLRGRHLQLRRRRGVCELQCRRLLRLFLVILRALADAHVGPA